MSSQLIKTLIAHLPRYAEEQGDFYAVKREDLINALCLESVNQAVAENTVCLIENLLDSLAVLNSDYLKKGEWCFISFPAQLLALSVLTTMSDKDSRLLVDNFWNTQGIDNDKKNKQRDLLKTIETNRVACHLTNNAPPIRYIYVAWSIIKLDNKVLFYQREDTQNNFNELSGDYGLIGGRFNQRDIADFIHDKPRYLKMLQSNCPDIKNILPETLKRELKEEAGLIFDQHYTFSLWRQLKPYRQAEGSAPNHAFTEYYFDIFHIHLTLAGYIHLQNKIKTDDKLVWFSLNEIEKGKTADGKMAYIKTLFDDFNQDKAAFKLALMEVSDSFNCPYQFKRDKYGLTLLQNTDKPLFAGVLGKEKVLPLVLTARQQAILLGLAAHNRGFEFAELADDIVLHPAAWLEVREAALQRELMALLTVLKNTDFVIEQQQERFFRLSVEPSLLYFDERLFTYCVQQADLKGTEDGFQISIERAAISSALGEIAEKTESFSITLNLADGLDKLAKQAYCADNEEAVKIQGRYTHSSMVKQTAFLALGLKSLLCRTNGKMSFCAKYDGN